MPKFKKLRWVGLLGAGLTLATVLPTGASSHREAPLISEDPVADNTDVYAFVSPDQPDKVTLAANWIPFEEPAGGPNFFKFGDDVLYQIHVDTGGDAVPDVSYEWRFDTQVQNSETFLYNTGRVTSIDDPDFNIRQTYTVAEVRDGVRTVLASGLPTPPVNIGPRSTPNYARVASQAVQRVGDYKVFAGQRDDPFAVDLGSVFDLLGLRPLNGAHAIPLPTENGVDGLGGYNVHTLAIQVPITALTAGGNRPRDPASVNAVIGVYSQTKRFSTRVLQADGSAPAQSGQFVNVSRLGNPLVNEVILPLSQKDKFNSSEPVDDAQFLPYVLDPEPGRLIPALYPGVSVPPAPRTDLAAIFLTGIPGLNQPANVVPSEMLRLNVAIPPSAPAGEGDRLGVLGGDNAGFPNGRRLEDDVTDIELRAVAGATPFTPEFNVSPNNILTDGVDSNDRSFLSSFPYLALPHQGYEHEHHRVGP